jgi:hypothetical protein
MAVQIGKVVIKAILDHRPDRHLGVWEQLLDRLRQQMGGGVADDLESIGIAIGDDAQRAS